MEGEASFEAELGRLVLPAKATQMSWRIEVGDFSPNGLALGLLQKSGT